MARSLGKIGEAFVELNVKADALQAQFTAAQKTARNSANRMAKSVDRVDERLKRAGQTAVTFGRALAALGTGAVVAALGNVVRNAVSLGDEIAKTADKVGLSVEALQELRFAAERSGVGTRTASIAFQRFSRRVGEAADGSGELAKTLDQYGISVKNADGTTRSNVDVLGDLADAVKNASSEQEQLRIAFKAFDSEGAAMVNLLRLGAAGMDELRGRARELGNVMSEETARSAERAADAMLDFREAIGGLGLVLAPALGPLSEFIEQLTGLTQVGIDNFTKDLKDFGLVSLRTRLISVNKEIESLNDNIDAATNGLSFGGRDERLAALNEQLEDAKRRAQEVEALIRLKLTPGGGLSEGAPPVGASAATPEGPILPSPRRPELNDIERTQVAIDDLIASLAQERDIATLTDTAQIALAETLKRLGIEFDTVGGKVRVLTDDYRNLGELIEGVAAKDALENPNVFIPEARPEVQGPQLPTPEEIAAERLTERQRDIDEALRRSQDAAELFGATVASSFEDAIVGAESFKDALGGVLETLARIILRQAVLGPLAESITQGTQGFFGSIPRAGGPVPAAGGAVLSGNRISGGRPGVITRRSITPFAAGGILHGEAGSEIVVPMSPSRIGPFLAALGARGGGSGPGVQVIDKRGTEAPPIETQERGAGNNRVIEVTVRDQVNRMMESGGGDSVMSSRFGLRPAAGRLRG